MRRCRNWTKKMTMSSGKRFAEKDTNGSKIKWTMTSMSGNQKTLHLEVTMSACMGHQRMTTL